MVRAPERIYFPQSLGDMCTQRARSIYLNLMDLALTHLIDLAYTDLIVRQLSYKLLFQDVGGGSESNAIDVPKSLLVLSRYR